MKIAILTASVGKGHNIVAKNLKEEIEKNMEADVKIIDYFKLYNFYIDKLSSKWYRLILQNFPLIYKVEYSLFANKKEVLPKNSDNRLVISNLKKIVGKDLSDVIIISVFPIANSGTSNTKFKKKYTIATDYGIHQKWIAKNTDAYFVANNEIKDKLIKNHVDQDKIHITGIPISKKYYKKHNKNLLKKELGIKNNRKIILLMGGGDGVLKDSIKMVKALSKKYNIIFATGTNKRLKGKIDNLKIPNCFTFGFTDKIKDLIDVSDIVISKAGGISITEFAVSHIPIIIYKITPGQEYDNVKYFNNNNACLIAENIDELKKEVDDIINKKIKLNTRFIQTKTPAIDQIIEFIKKDI